MNTSKRFATPLAELQAFIDGRLDIEIWYPTSNAALKRGRTSIYLDRNRTLGKYGVAFNHIFGGGDVSIEYEGVYPDIIRFLADTTPKNSQWNRPKNYYGESMGGTDWPDRWLIEQVA